MRLDLYLFQKGETPSREAAKKLITEGLVNVNGKPCKRPAADIKDGDEVEVTSCCPYVGRGAYKLKKAVEVFGLELTGLECGDFGASTGGFTQIMLLCGAKKVYAVDVGHGQLAQSLSEDSRVVSLEGVNIRGITSESFPCALDFAAADLSFISLKFAVPPISSVLKEGGKTIMLIKPQFECGRELVGKKGIIKSPKIHIRVIKEIIECFGTAGIAVRGLDYSPITGGSGNIEYLIFGEKGGEKSFVDIDGTVGSAWENLV
ncbi:MAG: TlyA family RNA methyltransferase [Oscillospiraceae bacterium]|nr:TlyA family RNA methyltransferase [Oscillospiraceae bacterium]